MTWKRVVLGLLFVATVAGTVALVLRIPGGLAPLVRLALGIPVGHLAAVLGLTVVFYLLDWVRFSSLLAILGYRLRAALGLELVSVSYFVSSLTPTADLHLPAMIYVLARHGVDPGQAGAASITKSIYQVTWICLIALIALAVAGDVHLPVAAVASLVAAAIPLGVLVTVFLAVIVFPQRALALTAPRAGRRPWLAHLAAGFHSAAAALARLGRSLDRQHVLCHAASIAFVFVYITIGWILCDALHLPMPYGRAIAVFGASLMTAYLAPVPGSIGVTEVVTSYLINPTLPPAAIVVAVILRFQCWYVSVIPGALLLAWELVRARRATPPSRP
jgi:uncharacterized membrane protein YbhN (UPF0104 family)